jgi:putative MATE family efflux protein
MLVASGIMRGAGDTRTPMLIAFITNVWTAVIGYALIFGLGPIPAFELAGAGIATSTARTIGGFLALGALFTGRTVIQISPRRLLTWDPDLAWRLLRLALPNLGEQGIQRIGYILFTRIIAALGTAALAAHQVAMRLESLSFMSGWGLGLAAATLVGQSLGAEREDVAELSMRRTLLFACGLMGAMGVLFLLFGRQMVALFGTTPEVRDLASVALQIAALEQISMAINMVLAGGLRGAGDTRTPLYVTLFGVLIFRVAVVYFFAISLDLGLAGVWLGIVADWTGRAILMILLFRRGRWKTIRV